ncbi:MAG: hypothetical protein JRI23_01505 [Deltaproteobacteria bacterium]|jgi:hypothetical protein|nr:hypothetical protein [Deltaproteobacteria bacterium]MBW2530138.1 hypothetical protein [Deltaproteobacteria bacterium]
MSEPTVVYAQLAVEGCTAELYLNGIPITRVTPRPRVPVENVAVEQFLVPGTNHLTLVVEPGSKPSQARTEYREMEYRPLEAWGRLLRFREGVPAEVEHGELLGEVSVIWADGKPARRTVPIEESTGIELGAAHGRWDWQDAPKLVLDDALVDEACAVMDELAMAIRTGHTGLWWQHIELQARDVQRAYPAITEAYIRGEMASDVQEYGGIDPVVPRDRSRHDFRLAGGDRLLQLVDEDWTSSLEVLDPGSGAPVAYRLMLARIGKTLRVVR